MGNTCCGLTGIPGPVMLPKQISEIQKKIETEIDYNKSKITETPFDNPSKPIMDIKEKIEKKEKNEINPISSLTKDEISVLNSGKALEIIDNKIKKEIENNEQEKNEKLQVLHIDLIPLELEKKEEKKDEKKEEKKDNVSKSPRKSTTKKKESKTVKEIKLINLEEIKLSDETTKKLKKLNDHENENKKNTSKSKLSRSKTIMNENKDEPIAEATEKFKQRDEFKKNIIEDQKKIERKHSDSSLGKLKSIKNDDNKTEKNDDGGASPRKSLLKRCKTIGDKKKVKFKDLDAKKRKKNNR